MMAMQHHAYTWLLPGCDTRCYPRSHSPQAHEAYGRLLGIEEAMSQRAGRIVRTGALSVNLDARTATVDGIEARLTPREWQLLAYLAEHVGRWCSEREIRCAIWDSGMTGGGTVVNTNRHRLRRRLGDAGHLVEVRDGGRVPGVRQSRLALVEVQP